MLSQNTINFLFIKLIVLKYDVDIVTIMIIILIKDDEDEVKSILIRSFEKYKDFIPSSTNGVCTRLCSNFHIHMKEKYNMNVIMAFYIKDQQAKL